VTQLPAQSKIVAQQPVETKINRWLAPSHQRYGWPKWHADVLRHAVIRSGVGSAWLWLAGFVSTMDHAPQALSLKCDSRWRLHSHPTAKI